ncbi:Uncharacterized protein TCM_012429 [Theobroma cacao]|uniref:Uncharacterized protein n=1 Tax=Theobroma cacao TaxID=3641 RepID=A0A061G232_THECC|nr:Uncharacterized protein TCM_012429 [Theobroma cacao]
MVVLKGQLVTVSRHTSLLAARTILLSSPVTTWKIDAGFCFWEFQNPVFAGFGMTKFNEPTFMSRCIGLLFQLGTLGEGKLILLVKGERFQNCSNEPDPFCRQEAVFQKKA